MVELYQILTSILLKCWNCIGFQLYRCGIPTFQFPQKYHIQFPVYLIYHNMVFVKNCLTSNYRAHVICKAKMEIMVRSINFIMHKIITKLYDI